MKKSFLPILMILLLISCKEEKKSINNQTKMVTVDNFLANSQFQNILDEAKVKGSILVYDLQKDQYHSNNFDWAKAGKLPVSTFKIPNSMIALETKVVEDENTLFKWNGEARRLKVWEQDLTFKEAFHYSCVPCYQDIARRVGEQRMNEHLQKFNYGNMDVNAQNIDIFWLQGNSKINQFQQIDFLKRFYQGKLPIATRTDSILRKMIVIEKNDAYTLSGKTGWSIRNGENNGWFVGYVKNQKGMYFFATNIAPSEAFHMDMFPKIRKEITYKALQKLNILL